MGNLDIEPDSDASDLDRESEECEESSEGEGSEADNVSEEGSEGEGSEADNISEEGSEGDVSEADNGSEEGSEGEGERTEEDEGKEKEGEGCENSRSYKWGKTYAKLVKRLPIREGEGEENEGKESEGCEDSGCFKRGKTISTRPIREEHKKMGKNLERKGEKYKKGSDEGDDSDEGEGSKEVSEEEGEGGEENEESNIGEEGEGSDEESEEQEEDEGDEENEQGSEDGEVEIAQGREDEESDISDSEIHEYKELVHKLLKYRTYKIKGPNGQLRCPFCVGKENQEYTRLLEHAVQVAEGSTERSAKQRANHFAMAKYLVIDLADYVQQLPLSANKMLCNLTLEIDLRKENTDQLQSKYEEKTIALRRILEKRDETQHTFFEEARNLLCIARDQSKRVLEQHEMLDFDFENKRRRLNSWSEELNKREAALTEEKRKMDDHYLAKVRQCNDELLEAGKELVKGLEDMPSHCRVKIGVKRRGGEINEEAFMSACKKKYLPHEAETKAVELCNFLEEKMRDLKGIAQEVLNEKDKLLGGLKDDNAVVAALVNNTSGNGMDDTVLWNFEEDRKASHCEVIRYIFSRWKALQCKRDEIDEVIKTLF